MTKSAKSIDVGIRPDNNAQIASDGKQRAEYNLAHGRKPNAPTVGGDRQATYDALLSPKGKRVPVAYLG